VQGITGKRVERLNIGTRSCRVECGKDSGTRDAGCTPGGVIGLSQIVRPTHDGVGAGL